MSELTTEYLDQQMDQLASKEDYFLDLFTTSEEATRCHGSLAKLDQHLQQPVTLTGSIATGWQLLRKGIRREKKHLSDIDVVVDGLSSILPSLSQDFLISHFHPSRGKGRLLIQLADAEYGTRIDLFAPNSETLTQRLTDLMVGDLACKAVSIEDVWSKLLSVIYPVTKDETIDSKYVEHFNLLSSAIDRSLAREIWRDYRKGDWPADSEEAAEAIGRSIKAKPELLRPTEYDQNINLVCRLCRESEIFPIANRSEIYNIWGYV